MDFELTDDQLELQRAARDVVEQECPPALLRGVLDGTADVDALWKTYVGLDWPSLAVPEAAGGMGFGAVELVLVLEELGRVADPTPFLATTSQYVPLVLACGGPDQQQALLAPVLAGGTGAVAWDGDVTATAQEGGGWTLTGTAGHVLDGGRADEIAAVVDGDVFVVPGAEVTAARQRSFDGTLHLAEITLDGVTVGPERALQSGAAAGVATARAHAVTGLAATMVGASQRAFELALGHIRDRKQFGVPIGSFQALKHMAADVYIAIERARAMCHFAALALDEADERTVMAASMAKAAAGEAQRIAVQHSIQFFGGLGFTWENDLHLYVRRAKAGELLLGNAAEHRVRVAREALAR